MSSTEPRSQASSEQPPPPASPPPSSPPHHYQKHFNHLHHHAQDHLPHHHHPQPILHGDQDPPNPVPTRSRKAGRMETITVTMVSPPEGGETSHGETEATTRERKISKVRKISDALTHVAVMGGIIAAPQHETEGTARERKISKVRKVSDIVNQHEAEARERKISRGRRISDAVTHVMVRSGVLAAPQHESEATARERKMSRGGRRVSEAVTSNENEGPERKISRGRRISDAVTHVMARSGVIAAPQYESEAMARERRMSKVRKISDAVTNIMTLNQQNHHGPTIMGTLSHQNTISLADLLKSEEQPDTKSFSSGSVDYSNYYHQNNLDDKDSDTSSLGKGENGYTLSGVGDINGEDGKKWPQVVASIAANMGAFAFGAVLAWSATGIPSMEDTEDLGELSSSISSWIGSIPTLGAVAACPFAGFALDTLGRKRSMLFLTVPFIVGWLLIGLAQNFLMVLFGRFITGFCGGCFSIAAPIFTAETADSSIRGGLGSLFDLLLSTGMLYIYVVGVFLSWRYQAIACAIIPVAFHIIMFFVPESPRYLIQRDKDHKAEKAIYWLKGHAIHPEFVQKEMSDLKSSVGETKGVKMSFGDAIDRTLVMPTSILIGIMFFTTLSGIDAIIAYTVTIFESAGSTMDPKLSTIIIGIVTMLASFPTAAIVDIAGRRVLLIASELVMSCSLCMMGLYFYMMRTNLVLFGAIEYQSVTWIPLASLVLFIIGYSLGCGPLSMMMIGELLPNRLKGLTSCIVLMTRWFLAFGVTNIFGTLKDVINDDGTYWLFASICFVGSIFIFFFVPETKGKSLAEIQLYFVGHKKNNIDLVTSANTETNKQNGFVGSLHGYDNKIDVES